MGRGQGQAQASGLSSGLRGVSSPPFDPVAVEALQFYQVSVGIIIDDNDPDPNTIKKLLVSTPLGQWEAVLSSAGEWEIEGQPVGPSLKKDCSMLVAFEKASANDLSKLQGPEAAERYRR